MKSCNKATHNLVEWVVRSDVYHFISPVSIPPNVFSCDLMTGIVVALLLLGTMMNAMVNILFIKNKKLTTINNKFLSKGE